MTDFEKECPIMWSVLSDFHKKLHTLADSMSIPLADVLKDCESRFRQIPKLYATDNQTNPIAYVRIFIEGTGAEWFISEFGGDPDYPGMAFGYCDLGIGFPELGYVDLCEVFAIENVKVDLTYKPMRMDKVREHFDKKYKGTL